MVNRYNNRCRCNHDDRDCDENFSACRGSQNRMSGGSGNITGAQNQLLTRLRKVDFALADTILYLDAYPNCKAAMEYYKKLVDEHKTLTEKLAQLGLPLTATSNCADTWEWINSPWPWEYDANL